MAVSLDRLRPMTDTDIPNVLDLEHAAFPVPWTEEMLRQELDAPGRSYLIGEDDSGVVAYGGFMLVEADAHIMTIAVSPQHRRNGIASRLMLAMIDSALEAGAEHLTLELRVSNAAARGLYERFGFSPVGIRPRYYVDEDALIMWAVNASGAEYSQMLEHIREEVA